jgi:hypothetical protein
MADRFEAPVGGVVAEAAGRLGTSVAEIGLISEASGALLRGQSIRDRVRSPIANDL